jgi:hypothetical protein
VTDRQQPARGTSPGVGLIVAAAVFALMMATEPRLAIVWDEGYSLGREGRVRDWFRALAAPESFAREWRPPRPDLVQPDRVPIGPPSPLEIESVAGLFSPRALAWFWPFAREEPHGHPPFYAIIGLIGDLLTPSRSPLARARLGPILAFSLTAGALFAFLARRSGFWAGATAAGAWTLQPHLFALGHYATYDALLACLWVGAILAFSRAVQGSETVETREARKDVGAGVLSSVSCLVSRVSCLVFKRGWTILFGILYGGAMGTKLTGWFLPLPVLAWIALYRDRRALRTLIVGGLIALVTVYVITPPWWVAPLEGPWRFFVSNLSRARTVPIRTEFLGRIYETPRESLPWYNTMVWTIFVTPVGFLGLALWGVFRSCRQWRTERFGLLAVGTWAFLLILRAMPHAPGHDGIRQFLPAFGALAIVAGLGAVGLKGRIGRALIGLSLAEGALSVALAIPIPLAYFSPIVGGLPGASALGMEPTYYWDALTTEALDWINHETRPGRGVCFATNPTSWFYLRQVGRLRPGIFPLESDRFDWYIVQNRPGAFSPLDRALIEKSGPDHVLVSKWGVPLIWAFPARALADRIDALGLEKNPGARLLRRGSRP